ncbi:MAG TPA: acyl-CoA thioesterase/bile acid-CoA:amino acid N-acyltransferase family protein [Candidatus Binataceae bacterium]
MAAHPMCYWPYMRLEAAPADALYDQPISLRAEGFPPAKEVRLVATAQDDLKRLWGSEASFVTDSGGGVNLATMRATSGSYHGADANGLLWSMQLDRKIAERGPFVKIAPTPVEITITAELDGAAAASAKLIRRFLASGVRRTVLREDGLAATLFAHDDGPRPGIVLIGGSGGGLSEEHPALLASHGYAVMSLGYFAMEGLPRDLMEIPLEYFERGIEWMRRHPGVLAEKILVIGASRGGELALLLGAMFKQISAVVAYVPSGVVWPGIGGGSENAKSAWTWRGKPIACVEPAPPDVAAWSRPPVALSPWFLESMKNQASAERAAIAVENINGPILMFSGTDDQMWPSLNLADVAIQRLMAKGFKHPYEHISYAGAGHFIRFPYSPVISEGFHPIVKTLMALGGTPDANHAANLDSWRRVLDFMRRHLG